MNKEVSVSSEIPFLSAAANVWKGESKQLKHQEPLTDLLNWQDMLTYHSCE